jgi:hypothetical protein
VEFCFQKKKMMKAQAWDRENKRSPAAVTCPIHNAPPPPLFRRNPEQFLFRRAGRTPNLKSCSAKPSSRPHSISDQIERSIH